ncbi:hypothetical protein OIDMADRAFT_52740 [Oidiodendron maius Zn]|uniref:BZIP domain-containing protein n=1 Tax=Oidiodendron maius (strain Zn) TaxID=913774 RepID=A0A0C3HKP5_OIDMZ|nr:hypothetical protein OIDMADRAFT_52740 [Oidiodendron maius Zn]
MGVDLDVQYPFSTSPLSFEQSTKTMEFMGEFPISSFWISSIPTRDVSEQATGSSFPPCASWSVASKSYDYEYPTVPHILSAVEGRIFTSQQVPAIYQEVAVNPGYVGVSVEYPYGNEDQNSDSRSSEMASTKLLRRRAQNRASQRAYRSRRDRKVKELQDKLDEIISQYEKLTREYAELSKMHDALKEKKQQWKGELEEDSDSEIANITRGSTRTVSSINGESGLGDDGPFWTMSPIVILDHELNYSIWEEIHAATKDYGNKELRKRLLHNLQECH